MEPEKEQWINDVLTSLDELNRATPIHFMFDRIRNRLIISPLMEHVSIRTLWLVTACFALLAVLNWHLIQQEVNTGSVNSAELNVVVNDLYLYPATHHLYDKWIGPNY